MKNLSVYIEVLILFMLFSCSKTAQRNTNNQKSIKDSINQIVSGNIIEKKNITHFNTIEIDTVMGDFRISYIIRDNNNVISRQSITSKGDSILLEYADRSVFLDIVYNEQTILSNKEINKDTFKSIIIENEIKQYQLWFFGIKRVEEEGILFNVNICIPDTDMCYLIALYISKNGNFIISEIEMDETDD